MKRPATSINLYANQLFANTPKAGRETGSQPLETGMKTLMGSGFIPICISGVEEEPLRMPKYATHDAHSELGVP